MTDLIERAEAVAKNLETAALKADAISQFPSLYDRVLRRLDASLRPEPALGVLMRTSSDGKPYWQVDDGIYGGLATSAAACRWQEKQSRLSIGNIPRSLARIPWC